MSHFNKHLSIITSKSLTNSQLSGLFINQPTPLGKDNTYPDNPKQRNNPKISYHTSSPKPLIHILHYMIHPTSIPSLKTLQITNRNLYSNSEKANKLTYPKPLTNCIMIKNAYSTSTHNIQPPIYQSILKSKKQKKGKIKIIQYKNHHESLACSAHDKSQERVTWALGSLGAG